MLKKNTYLRALGVLVVIGIPGSLLIGFLYNVLSPREWAIGMFAWVAGLLLWASALKGAENLTVPSIDEPTTAVSEEARNRILRRILKSKVWICVLVILLPIGIVNGIVHRAWLPTFSGTGISVLFIYVAMRDIKKRRKQLNLMR